MGKVTGMIRILSADEMELIHRSALLVLTETGMRIENEEALSLLQQTGCDVNFDTQEVKFPPAIVETAIEHMKKDFLPFRVNGAADRYAERVPMRYTAMYFSTKAWQVHSNFDVNCGGFSPYVYDLDGNRRTATLQDVRDGIRLADALGNIDLIGLPCSANEVPSKLRPVVMAAELVKLTSKLGGVEAWSVKDVNYIARIAEVVAGSAEALHQKPILVGYGEARSPLCIDNNMASILIDYIRRGFPQSLDTMPAAGTTAPATSAGALTLGLAETLGGLTLAYAVRPDAVISLDLCPTLSDMRSMIFPYSGADRIPLVAATVQMLGEFYGRPGGCHGGKTDACMPGAQAGVEKALSIIFPILAGATGVGTLGHIENALTFSFEQLVIDNEIAGYIKRMLQGFEVTEETIALDVIKEVGINGNYLQHPHTALHFRKEFWLPDLMERVSWETWNGQNIKGLEAKARERAHKILANHHPQPLSGEKMRAIDAIVEEARRDPWYQ